MSDRAIPHSPVPRASTVHQTTSTPRFLRRLTSPTSNDAALHPTCPCGYHTQAAAEAGTTMLCGNARLRRGVRLLALLSVAVIVVCLLVELLVGASWLRDVGYLTRPLWDSPGPAWTILPHFSHPHLDAASLCHLHGWTARHPSQLPAVWDAFPFLHEVDLLDLRLHELYDVVDHFLIAESTRTFTGIPKPLHLLPLLNTSRLRWAHPKVIHLTVPMPTPHPHHDAASHAWDNEANMRRAIAEHLHRSGAKGGDLVLQSDVDEMPTRDTVALLRACEGYPTPLHLNLANYQYSFAFRVPLPADGVESWRAAVVQWRPGSSGYRHSRQSNWLLDGAGWHCSFCFRHLQAFRTKMTGYSHADRVTHPALLEWSSIQSKVCEGRDLFDMYHEVYAWRDLWDIGRGLVAQTALTHLPRYLLEHPTLFAFLLPGGCMRNISLSDIHSAAS